MRFGAETGRMDVGPSARQQHAVDRIQQRFDIRDVRRARKHHRQRARHVRHRAKVSFADKLHGKPVFEEMGVADHANHGFHHCAALT